MHLMSRRLTKMRLVLLVVLVFVLLQTGGANIDQQQVTVKKLDAPATVDPRSEKVVMHCDYELRGKLYSVSWYKLDKMLFRYAPNLSQKATVFPHEFVKVSLQESNARQLVLLGHGDYRKNKRAYEGTFICEVSVDHTFSTSYAVANVSAAVLPEGDPKLQVATDRDYELGERLEAACTSLPSLPPAEVSFYVNEQKVNHAHTHSEETSNSIDSDAILSSTKVSLSMTLERRHFQKGSLALECRARLPNVTAAPEFKTLKSIYLGSSNQRWALNALRNGADGSSARLALFRGLAVVVMLKRCFADY